MQAFHLSPKPRRYLFPVRLGRCSHLTPCAQQTTDDANNGDTPMPAAYYEDLSGRPAPKVESWPDYLNLQGVDNFDPTDAVYYLLESGVTQQKIKQQRWVNDSSLNLQFYSAEDAAVALQLLSHPEAGDPASIPPETARRAKPWKDRELIVRQANSGDQKVRGAANQSKYYERNPDVRGGDRRGDRGREREPRRRQPPRRDYLDYGDEEPVRGNRRRYNVSPCHACDMLKFPSRSGDEQMRDGSDYENRRNRRTGRERDGRLRAADVDSYRPGSKRYKPTESSTRYSLTLHSPRESRFGRLRGRSASPVSGDDGDGRYGFTEQGTSTRGQYRSRSRTRDTRRRREPSVERWTHDRANYDREGDTSGGRWTKDSSAVCH